MSSLHHTRPTDMERVKEPEPATQRVNQQIDEVTKVMAENLHMMVARGENLQTLQKNTEELTVHADIFKKRAREAKKKKLWEVCSFLFTRKGLIRV